MSMVVNWNNFLAGEAQLECETLEDAQLLLQICQNNNIDCRGIEAVGFTDEPYWYVKDGWSLEMTRYYCDCDSICSAWTVRDYMENHVCTN